MRGSLILLDDLPTYLPTYVQHGCDGHIHADTRGRARLGGVPRAVPAAAGRWPSAAVQLWACRAPSRAALQPHADKGAHPPGRPMRSAKRETASGARYRPLQPGCAVGKPALARILPLEWLCAVAAGVVPVQRRGSSYRRVGRLGHRRGLARAMRGCPYSGRCVCAVSTLPTLECWHMQVVCGSASEPRRSHGPSAH